MVLAGPSTTLRSQVVGGGGPYTDIVSRPWPTEHRYEQGEPIRVEWSGAPGNRYDWLSLIRSCFDPEACPLRQWRYVNAESIGTGRFMRDSEGIWPLRPGRYAVGLCVDDDYECIATSEVFRIVAT